MGTLRSAQPPHDRGPREPWNLFVEDLPSFWRLFYAVVRDRGERSVVVVEIVDYRTYDGWVRRRGR